MLLYPAIDLMNGEVVRLKQGRASEKTVYSKDPVAFAKKWALEGGDWLHIVDLDGAFTGKPTNLAVVRQIVAESGIPVELGGGLRSPETVAAALDAGVSRVIIGTSAVESPDFVAAMVAEHGGERIAAGIDARNGLAAVRGWTESGAVPALDLVEKMTSLGVGTIIYTDIATDGMLEGPNFAELDRVLAATTANVIASGGVSTLEDLITLNSRQALHGAIIGKALYDARIDLAQAAAALQTTN